MPSARTAPNTIRTNPKLTKPGPECTVWLPMITANQLVKTFGSIRAVDGVSFEVEKGETFGLLGPNGAGKSTTINMLSGILSPDEGSVQINGASDPTRSQVRRQLGLAPQALAIYEDLTARENLHFFGGVYGLSGSALKERATDILELVGLTDRAGSRAREFSGGMQRRLNLACALIHDPPVLMLDEPTVGVDPQSRNLIFDRIEQLRTQGRTILYTTHYMEEAERLCDRVAIIDHGRILALDTVERLIEDHGGQAVITGELTEPPDDPSVLPGTVEDTSVRIETKRPLEVVGELAGSGLKFRTLKIDRADLEQVFLNLTGRRLRD